MTWLTYILVDDETDEDTDTASHLIVWKLPQSTEQQNSLLDYIITTTTDTVCLEGIPSSVLP